MTLLSSCSGDDGPVTSGFDRQRAASLDSLTSMKLERNSVLRQLLTAAPANLSIAKQPRPARLDAAVLACRPCTTVSAQITPKKSPRRLSREDLLPLKPKSQQRDGFHDTTPPLEQSDSTDKVACPKKRRSLGASVSLLMDMPPLLSRADSVNTSLDGRGSPSTDSGFESSSPASPESAIGETQSTVPPLLASVKPLEQPKVSPLARSQCQWQWCSLSFENDTLLFDHVIQTHIRPLKSSEPAHNTRRRRSISDCGQLQCRWGQCEMKLERGDVEKRYAWLEDHFTTRHPGRAQPYPCLIAGCQQRFSFKRALSDHLRSGHDKLRAAAKRDLSDTGTTTEETQKRLKRRSEQLPVSLYAMPVDPKMDFLDAGTGEILAGRLLAMETTRRRRLLPAVAYDDDVHGAARRKLRRLTVHEVYDASKKRATAAAHSNATPLADRCRARPVLCALFAQVVTSKVAVLH